MRLRRAKLVHVGTRVLGSEAAARTWASTPQPTLYGAVPDELAETLDGLQEALAALESLGAP